MTFVRAFRDALVLYGCAAVVGSGVFYLLVRPVLLAFGGMP